MCLRLYLESVAAKNSDGVSLILMIFGLANLVGTLLTVFRSAAAFPYDALRGW